MLTLESTAKVTEFEIAKAKFDLVEMIRKQMVTQLSNSVANLMDFSTCKDDENGNYLYTGKIAICTPDLAEDIIDYLKVKSKEDEAAKNLLIRMHEKGEHFLMPEEE